MAVERKHLVISTIAGVFVAGLIIAGAIFLPYISGIISTQQEITSIPDENPPEVTTPPPIIETSKMGTLLLMLTDAPPRTLKELNITIDEVRLLMAGNKTGEGPIVNFSLSKTKEYCIQELNGILGEIGNNNVPEGKYVAIWLHIVSATATFKDDPNKVVNLRVVANGWLKIQLHFEVNSGKVTVIVLDFDLEQTHVSNDNTLRPVIKLKQILGP
jgi:hypothetical protein